MDMRELQALQAWYLAQCDGDWEHQCGVKVETLDNPGWIADIDLAETALEGRPLSEVLNPHEHDVEWLRCWCENDRFRIACGPTGLADGIRIFLEWAGAI